MSPFPCYSQFDRFQLPLFNTEILILVQLFLICGNYTVGLIILLTFSASVTYFFAEGFEFLAVMQVLHGLETKVQIQFKDKLFHYEDSQALEQVVQRSSAFSRLRGFQDPSG